jgi:hypothetical protein
MPPLSVPVIALGRNMLLQFRHFRRPWRSVAGAVRDERNDARTGGAEAVLVLTSFSLLLRDMRQVGLASRGPACSIEALRDSGGE